MIIFYIKQFAFSSNIYFQTIFSFRQHAVLLFIKKEPYSGHFKIKRKYQTGPTPLLSKD